MFLPVLFLMADSQTRGIHTVWKLARIQKVEARGRKILLIFGKSETKAGRASIREAR